MPAIRRSAAVLTVLTVTALTTALTGCSDADTGSSQTAQTPAPAASSDDPLQQDARHLQEVLTGSLQGQEVTAERVRSGIAQAGWSGQDVEVGQDTTPTGLDVDSVDAAVKTRDQCLLADVRPDGAVSVSTGPALSDGRCFAGHRAG
ncbi:DUF6993 domain-containing protein [Rothia kristinae]|uniref:DUF6993 domain-containing protein n=1 Tax=Rothia kristinae TaxID=37923 RepID=A0A199NS32_9MICC|nr:hypothetical protein [Rothia kristinae]OAX51899.1 hypothetical protein AN277_0206090 [Rothia kristinae]